MKLNSIQVRNYRSIVKTTKLRLSPGLTVILGPNNEGKSNLLRAIVLAMECLSAIRRPVPGYSSRKESSFFRLPPRIYEWDTDFPLAEQNSHPDGETKLTLEFALSDEERRLFRNEIGSTINQSLPLEITVGARGVRFKVKKQGKAAEAYESKSQEIARFVSGRFEFEYIPAIRPSDLSLEVVASLIERELGALSSDPEYRSALETIESLQRPVYERLAADVQTYLKMLLPSVKEVKIGTSHFDNYRPRFRVPQFIVDDGTATELEAKGDGIKSLAAISLMRATKAGGTVGDLVVAIEEPESHLHPEAIRQLAIVLQEMAKEHQVIITTHSPLLVARNQPEANIIVSKSSATPASGIAAVRDSLGVKVGDNLSSAEFVIVVEGDLDDIIYRSLLTHVSPEFRELVQMGKVAFDKLDGTGNIVYKLSTLRQLVATPILLLDGDGAGRECAKKAERDGKLGKRYIFLCQRKSTNETEVEDLLEPNCYWTAIEERHGVKLDQTSFLNDRGKWSDRMHAAFEKGFKSWSESVRSDVKKTVAECVQTNPESAILPSSEEQLRQVAVSIVNIVNGRDQQL